MLNIISLGDPYDNTKENDSKKLQHKHKKNGVPSHTGAKHENGVGFDPEKTSDPVCPIVPEFHVFQENYDHKNNPDNKLDDYHVLDPGSFIVIKRGIWFIITLFNKKLFIHCKRNRMDDQGHKNNHKFLDPVIDDEIFCSIQNQFFFL